MHLKVRNFSRTTSEEALRIRLGSLRVIGRRCRIVGEPISSKKEPKEALRIRADNFFVAHYQLSSCNKYFERNRRYGYPSLRQLYSSRRCASDFYFEVSFIKDFIYLTIAAVPF